MTATHGVDTFVVGVGDGGPIGFCACSVDQHKHTATHVNRRRMVDLAAGGIGVVSG
jgi:hypothetical protein